MVQHVVVHILLLSILVELTEDFPKEQPSLVLRSVYHCLDGLPCQSIISDYPYSPRWGSEEMAERLRSALSLPTSPLSNKALYIYYIVQIMQL